MPHMEQPRTRVNPVDQSNEPTAFPHWLHSGAAVLDSAGRVLRMNTELSDWLGVTPAGRPSEVRFDFDVPLEDRSLYFVQWQDGAYLPFDIPASGETAHVPATRLTDVLPIAFGRKRMPDL